MLQTQKLSPIADKPIPAPEEAGFGDMASFAIGVIQRQYLVISFVSLIVTLIGVTYLAITPATYTSKTQLIIDRGKNTFLQQQGVVLDTPIDSAQVESQIQILASERVAASVVKSLHLTEDPEFIGTGSALGFNIFKSNELAKSNFDPVHQAAAALLKNLQVNRVGIAFILEVNYRSHSPERAAQIANAIAEAYIYDQMDSKYESQRRSSEWLQNRVNELRKQAVASEEAVNAYKTRNNMVTAGGTLIGEQEVAELNRQLVGARAKTSESLARLDRIEQVLRCGDAGANSSDRTGANSCVNGAVSDVYGTVSDVLTNPIVTKLRQQYLDLVNREADFSTRYGRDHTAVVNLRNQIRDIQNSILNELRRLGESFKSDYLISKQRQESVERDLAKSVAQAQETTKAQATLRELESAAQSTRSVYDSFLQRYTESLQQQTYVTTEARVIAPAVAPQQKSSPKTVLVLALSVVGGLGAGIGLGLLRDMMDRVFRTGEQIEGILRVPCVALMPLIKNRPQPGQTPLPAKVAVDGARNICRDAGVFWTVVDSPLSSFAEATRAVKLAVDLQGVNGLSTVIGFTSALPNEGKSTTATALALLMGQVGHRVILIDCDLRNPSITRSLAPNATAGIIEVLFGEKSVEQVSWRCPVTNLVFLPGIVKSHLLHTSEILASAATKKLIEQLRLSYDYVVIDLPPLAPIVDVRATAHLVDFYFLVVEWGGTKIDIVQHALSRARPVSENLVGAVLNKTDMAQISRYDGRRKEYYNNEHYARYGYTS